MFEVHVTVSCPDLLAAAQLLAKGSAAPAASAVAIQPTVPVTTPAPTTVAPATASVVPLASAPTYSMAQIAKAGADLISQNPALLPQVNALLSQYGVQAVTEVKPEDYGAFATALRGMGAKI